MFRFLTHTFRRYFVTGLIVLVPLTVSIRVFIWALSFLDNILKPVVEKYLEGYVFGLGIVILLLITLGVGVVAQNYFGRKIVHRVERLFDRLPFIRVVYSAVKQLLEPFNTDRGYSLTQVVLIEYPMKDRLCIGFLANEDAGRNVEGEKLVSVFIPSNHLHLGYLVIMPDRDVKHLDLSVEEALKLVVSCGIVISKPFDLASATIVPGAVRIEPVDAQTPSKATSKKTAKRSKSAAG